MSLASSYDPKTIEVGMYALWEQLGVFAPEINDGAAERYSLVIPPPNVTGTLHMGHALDCTIQDVLVRWQRMLGKRVLWVPGSDHAGIATQTVVERHLKQTTGQTRHDVGREAFLDTVWEWANNRQADIKNQLTRLGISPDWQRQRFTLDEGLCKAVRAAFVRLYNLGLIYQGERIVNWDPQSASAVSDIETYYVEEQSHLWHIGYALPNGQALVVATTRPETLFGDVAVAVHPNDERYKAYIGQHVTLPLTGRTIPIIADDYVDPSFGTGCLKITPAHDPNDFEVGQRHQLTPLRIMDDAGCLLACDAVPVALHGMERFAAREQTEAMLQAEGVLVSKQEHTHRVARSQRTDAVIEPLLSKQWFVKTQPLAQQCLTALDNKEIQFIPERWEKEYRRWLEHIQDWCISRQLWWGHRIPAWHCPACGHITVTEQDPTGCTVCGHTHLKQDPDVLDTWFSSGLWPFSTMGWPNTQAPDLQAYFATDVLVTGFDIIFFWVARMTMMSHGLLGQTPFKTVYIHGLIRDEKGQKMSKSKGNTVDPVETIDAIGCDAFRFGLTSLITYGGQDIKLAKDKLDQGRLFANKLWNASRFVMMNLQNPETQQWQVPQTHTVQPQTHQDVWILNALRAVEQTTHTKLTEYRFSEYCDALYSFTWDQFCDWYIEGAKAQLKDPELRGNTQAILLHVLEGILRQWHPIMPYITEAIWQTLPSWIKTRPSISVMPFAKTDLTIAPGNITTPEGVSFEGDVIGVIKAIRNARQSFNVPHSAQVNVLIEAPAVATTLYLQQNEAVLRHFVKLDQVTIATQLPHTPPQCAINVVGNVRVLVPLAGLIDVAAEQARIGKKLAGLEKDKTVLTGLLNNPGFLAKATEAMLTDKRQLLAEAEAQHTVLQQQLSALV
jgi:valyl-tRNA synthetase